LSISSTDASINLFELDVDSCDDRQRGQTDFYEIPLLYMESLYTATISTESMRSWLMGGLAVYYNGKRLFEANQFLTFDSQYPEAFYGTSTCPNRFNPSYNGVAVWIGAETDFTSNSVTFEQDSSCDGSNCARVYFD